MAFLTDSEQLAQEVQSYLGGSDSILIRTIQDLSNRVGKGKDSVGVPRMTGLALKNVSDGTTEQTAGGMATASDTLVLDQMKEVPEFILYQDENESVLDLKAQFLEGSPRVMAQGIEALIASKLETNGSAANNFESPQSGAGNFSIDDFATCKRILDVASVPLSERYVALNPVDMEKLASFAEFEDGAKSLSVEALREGIVSRIKGFNVVQSNDITAGVITAYHKSAVAFAMQDEVHYIQERQESMGRTFIALRSKFGCKELDLGERRVSILTAS